MRIKSFKMFLCESYGDDVELYRFSDWDEFQDMMNETGNWDNQTLRKSSHWKRIQGKKVLNIKDPSKGSVYYGLMLMGDLIGYTNVYEDRTIWIGDFEIFRNIKGHGYGKLMFQKLLERYPNKGFELTFGDKNALVFWTKMGFTRPNPNTKLMEYNV